jgi:anti-sigma factor RsiW
MKNECAKYKDLLLEAALSENSAGVLDQHLRQCGACANQLAGLRARRERLDTLLPLVLGAAEPSPGFRARVLAEAESANEASYAPGPRVWVLAAAAAAVLVAALLTGVVLRRNASRRLAQDLARAVPPTELVAAETLAEWRAPSDVLLETPGREFLRSTPRLGESYLRIAPAKDEEK